jgi:hypothetical protein
MRLMALTDFFYKDVKKGKMQHVGRGGFFELDLSIDSNHQQASELISIGRCAVVDETIPTKAKYRILIPFTIEGVDPVSSNTIGEVVTLQKDDAVFLLSERKVIPADKNQWFPFKEGSVSNVAKKMYD